jgi:hypothetical protein
MFALSSASGVKRSGGWETLRAPASETLMKTAQAQPYPWMFFVIGATTWFGLWAIYGFVTTS